MAYSIINGQLLPEAEALISVQDRGFRYGDGVFESIAVHQGVPYQFDWHLQRLKGGLQALKIAFDTAVLPGQIQQLLAKNACENGLLRLQITRGTGSRGYLPDQQARASCIIETTSRPALPAEPVALWRSTYRKISAAALPVQYKLCQGLNSTLARMEAAEQGCFDGLLLNEHGQVSETSSANIFWLKNTTLYTPALNCGILNGSTRAATMRLYPTPVYETTADSDTLMQADAVFITNAAWGAIAVNRLSPQDIQWQSEAIAQTINSYLNQDKDRYSDTHRALWK